jgi:hypothetical protein
MLSAGIDWSFERVEFTGSDRFHAALAARSHAVWRTWTDLADPCAVHCHVSGAAGSPGKWPADDWAPARNGLPRPACSRGVASGCLRGGGG